MISGPPSAHLFVDGENITFRYQDQIANGRMPKRGTTHIEDTFVWNEAITSELPLSVLRVTYYTSATGDADKISELEQKISNIYCKYPLSYFGEVSGSVQIVPKIFKKERKSKKTRNVDINIIIDMLRAARNDHPDVLILVSGDGDYLPLVDEVSRSGKQIWLQSFDSGLSKKLKAAVDRYENLDRLFF